jgi:hypothetical protein
MAQLLDVINPSTDIVNISGHEVTGFADDSMLTISRDEDVMLKTVGVQGDMTLYQNQNRTGTLTIRLQETSPTNDFFSGILAGMRTGTIKGVVPFTVIRNGSYSSISGGQCWIQGQPDRTYGKEGEVYEWTFGVFDSEVGILGAIEQAQDIAGL